jgi:cellulose synthase (UDP-forming)
LIISAFLLFNTFIPAWQFYFFGRMKRPNKILPLPNGRVAMVVTKAPSEPWSLVEKTLNAMLNQDFPQPFDVWLADESPDDDTVVWCIVNGVKLSTRMNVPEYHNRSWRRRTKSKEGNLAYFYDTYGYNEYDFVVQMDADHCPEASYLTEMIRPFINPKVGYVAAPSICDANRDKSWTVRARLYAEASLHGPLQAGYCGDGWAPLCIGSHYAVRTSALKEIGGLGPELAEDHSTTLMLNNAGWQGAFAIDAIAHGEGADSFSASMTQEFQWSRSLTNILLTWRPIFSKNLTLKKKCQFLFSELWYATWSIQIFIGSLLPSVALLTGLPWVSVNYLDFLFRYLILALACLIPQLFLHSQKVFRPVDAPVVSWESSLFLIVRWPWALIGVIASVFDYVFKNEFKFKVTPKGDKQTKKLGLVSVFPYALIILVTSYFVYFTQGNESVEGYRWLAILDIIFYVVALVLVTLRHIYENKNNVLSFLSALHGIAFSVTGVLILFVLISTFLPTFEASEILAYQPPTPTQDNFVFVGVRDEQVGPRKSPTPQPIIEIIEKAIPIFPTPTPNPVVDLSLNHMLTGIYDPSGTFKDVHFDIWHGFVDWDDISGIERVIRTAQEHDQFPMITTQPFPIRGLQHNYILPDISNGIYDEVITDMVLSISESSPQKVIVRWGHEMDLCAIYPWSSCAIDEYISAFRHVVDLSRDLGVSNILWLWSPAGGRPNSHLFYPGDDYVDFIGITGLVSEDWDNYYGESTAPRQFVEMLHERYGLANYIDKPLIIAEFGVSYSDPNVDRTPWLENAFLAMQDNNQFPNIVGWVYFNEFTNPQSRISWLPDFRVTFDELYIAMQRTGGLRDQ